MTEMVHYIAYGCVVMASLRIADCYWPRKLQSVNFYLIEAAVCTIIAAATKA